MVAGPRNQRYLQGEVVGFRRPLRLYGGPQHGRQIPPQLDLKRLAVLAWREHDGIYEAAQRLGGLRPAVRLLERSGELCDLGAVDPGHLRMQQRRRLVGGGELGLQLLTPSGVRIHLVAHFRRRDAVHHHLDQLLPPDLDALDLALGCREAGAVLHPKPVHLASEFVAEFLEELLVQELLLESLENPRFNFVSSDGEVVAARALLASAEAGETVAAGHDEAGAAHAALRQPREEVLRSSREADVAGARDRTPGCTLAVLRGVPEFVAQYPEGRNLLGDPLCLRIQPRDAFVGIRILDVAQPVPDQATDVQLVVQDARTAFWLPWMVLGLQVPPNGPAIPS